MSMSAWGVSNALSGRAFVALGGLLLIADQGSQFANVHFAQVVSRLIHLRELASGRFPRSSDGIALSHAQ